MSTHGADILARLDDLRAVEESTMLSCVRITRTQGRAVDRATGDSTTVEALVYEGCASILTYDPYESTTEVGAAFLSRQRYYLDLPVGAGPVREGDKVVAVDASTNPALVGREYRVAAPIAKTWATKQRVFIDERAVQ